MHSSDMEDVESAKAGDLVTVYGMEYSSMDIFTDGTVNFSMVSMFVLMSGHVAIGKAEA